MTDNKKVIEFPKPKEPQWRVFGWESANGAKPVDDWFRKELDEGAQFALKDALKAAVTVEKFTNWLCFQRFLKGKYQKYKIWELWFASGDKREYRLLGVFGSGRKQVIILLGCYHKGSRYTPENSLDTAFDRARDLVEGKAKTYERKIPIDQ